MTYLHAMHTATSSLAAGTDKPPEEDDGGVIGSIVGWFIDLADMNPYGGALGVFGAIGLFVWMNHDGNKGRPRKSKEQIKRDNERANQVIEAIFRGIGRILTGRPLHGRTDAGWFRPATRTVTDEATEGVSVAQLGAVGIDTAPTVPLAKRAAAAIDPWPAWGRIPATFVVTVVASVGGSLAGLGAVLKSRKRWARLPRLLVVLGPPAGGLAWLLYPDATREYGILAAWFAAPVFLVMAITGPHGYGLWHWFEPGDDDKYAPSLWYALRTKLDLPEEVYVWDWLSFPVNLKLDGATITVRLPQAFVGSDIERAQFDAIVNSRVPGEWVSTWQLQGDQHFARWTPKPPPKPEPEPPDYVDLFDERIQRAIANCAPGEYVLGIDSFGRAITRSMEGDDAHWAISAGSGSGKSAFLMMLSAQVMRDMAHIVYVDPKGTSAYGIKGIVGVYLYDDLRNAKDWRDVIRWMKEEAEMRKYERMRNPGRQFKPLVVFLEECNEIADILRDWWDANKKQEEDQAQRQADPIWREVASAMRVGREFDIHIVALFQDLRDNQFGGVSLRPLFNLTLMARYDGNQWGRILKGFKFIPAVDKAGRMLAVLNGEGVWFQFPVAHKDRETRHEMMREHFKALREHYGYDPNDLFELPPAPSAPALPKRLQRLKEAAGGAVSRDNAQSLEKPSQDPLSDETAGRGVTHTGDVTDLRDRLRLIPGQAGHPEADPTAPPELLPLAEVARRLQGVPGIPSYAAMRQHKNGRRADFPTPTVIDGKELYTVNQIRAYYEAKRKDA